MSDSDEELMIKVRNGDHNAFQLLVSRHVSAISNFIGRMMPGAAEVEDIVQETFFKLWLQNDKWHPDKASLSTWLYAISRNLCIDYFRKHQRMEYGVLEEQEEAANPGNQPETKLDSMVTAERVRMSISSLPERQRTALILCHYQGLSNHQAAHILDISVEALESLLVRARRKLKSLLIKSRESE